VSEAKDDEREKIDQLVVAPRRDAADRHLAVPGGTPALPLARATEFSTWDEYGHKFLDLTSGDGFCPLGYRNPAILAATREVQALYDATGAYGRYLVGVQADYAQMLSVQYSPDPQKNPYKVAFASTGEEALFLAIRLAFGASDRPGLVHLAGNGYVPPGSDELPVGAIPPPGFWDDKAALLIEVVQHDSGCAPMDADWLRALTTAARERGVAIIADERWTGYGRLGLIAGQFIWRVDVDMTVLGGPGGGGYPFGAVAADPRWFSRPWSVSPQSGHPVIMAAGMAVLAHLSGNLLLHVREMGDTVFPTALAELCAQFPEYFRRYQGAGMLYGVQATSAEAAAGFVARAASCGLVLATTPRQPDWLRLAPPLLSSEDFLRSALDALADVCLD
jgi:acetylornithine aminotransferase